jgi:16S rRNA (adenine1518-N6/adenine1519-N6)-dimethyltransferase
MNYNSAVEIRSFLAARGMGMRKKFGQNFLINPRLRTALVDALELPAGGPRIWEVGPGLGAMTGEILSRGGDLSVFEIDRGFCAVLREFFGASPRFQLVEGDVFKTWPIQNQAEGEKRASFFLGNLPYNIAASLLADLIEGDRYFSRQVVLVQREVAERISAAPGTAAYASISVLCQSVYAVKSLGMIGSASFYPAPQVESGALRLDLRNSGPFPPLFRPLVRHLFLHRRKTIRNNLISFIASRSLGGLRGKADSAMMEEGPELGKEGRTASDVAAAALERIGVDLQERAERLPWQTFSALAEALGEE